MRECTVDRHGQPLSPGDRIRILAITLDPDLDEDDIDRFRDMIGSVCSIDRIEEDGAATVTMWWYNLDGPLYTSVLLAPGQMEKAAP